MTKMLDLDAVHQDIEEVAIKLGGAVHKLRPLSVLDYIENTKVMQKLRAEASDMEKEFEATLVVVARSFPTVVLDDLRKLTFVQLNKLVAFSREANGETTAPAPVPVAAPIAAPVEAPAPAPAADPLAAVAEAAVAQAIAPVADVAPAPAPAVEVASIGSENPPVAQ